MTFLPHTRRIYAEELRMTLGFRSYGPLAQRFDASYAVRVPQAGSLLTASFRFHLAVDTLAVRLEVPVIKALRGLPPPSHFPGRFPLPVCKCQGTSPGASRHAWRTIKKGHARRRAL